MNELIKFKNGLTLTHNYIDSVRSVAIGVMVAAGCVNETKKENGISHFIEHMMFKGTTSRTAFQIADDLDSVGAMFNAYTSKQNTCYYTVSVDEYADKCMEVLSDIYFNSTFPEDEMEKEKGVVLEEINMTEDTPDDICLELLSSEYYKGHTLGKTILGPQKNVKGFTKEQLHAYVDKYYVANNTVISIVGDIKKDDAIALVNKYFTDNFSKKTVKKKGYDKHVTSPSQVVKNRKINQANVGIAFPGFPLQSKEETVLKLFNTAFGDGMTSRLFQRIREERGLVYSIFSMPSCYMNDGFFTIFFASNPKSVEVAIKEIKKEIMDVVANGITEKEFERAKIQLKSGLVLGSESTIALMRACGNKALLSGDTFDIDKKIAEIENASIDDVKKVVEYIFDFDKVVVSYVGPKIEYDILDELRRN